VSIRALSKPFLQLDLPDFVEMHGYILLHGGSQPVYVAEYRRQVEQGVLDLIAAHPTILALEQGGPVSDEQLLALERTLRSTLGAGALELSEDNIRKAYAVKVGSLLEFLRYLLDIEGIPDYREIVARQFAAFINQGAFNAGQVRFLRAVREVFLQKRRLEMADLYAPPLTSFGFDAVEKLFDLNQVEKILLFTNNLRV
jgi:type I restriction enzyme, R subunit